MSGILKMDEAVRKRLIFRPLIGLAVLFIMALLVIYFIPNQLSKALSILGGSEQTVEFPAYMGYIVIFAFIFRPALKFVENLVLIKKWEKGTIPSCPVCRHPMMQRIAKRGSYAGQRFWGCIQFPNCGGKVHIG